jgi:hypothetical protein
MLYRKKDVATEERRRRGGGYVSGGHGEGEGGGGGGEGGDEKDRIDQAVDNTVEGGVKLEGKAKKKKSEKEGRFSSFRVYFTTFVHKSPHLPL